MGDRTGWIENMSSASHTHHLVTWPQTRHQALLCQSLGAYCIVNVQFEQTRSSRSRVMCVGVPKVLGLRPSPNIWSRDLRLDLATGFAYGQIPIACFQWTARLIRIDKSGVTYLSPVPLHRQFLLQFSIYHEQRIGNDRNPVLKRFKFYVWMRTKNSATTYLTTHCVFYSK